MKFFQTKFIGSDDWNESKKHEKPKKIRKDEL